MDLEYKLSLDLSLMLRSIGLGNLYFPNRISDYLSLRMGQATTRSRCEQYGRAVDNTSNFAALLAEVDDVVASRTATKADAAVMQTQLS